MPQLVKGQVPVVRTAHKLSVSKIICSPQNPIHCQPGPIAAENLTVTKGRLAAKLEHGGCFLWRLRLALVNW
jgi:hypothetical protein